MKVLLITVNTSLNTAGSNQMLALARFLIEKNNSVSCVFQFARHRYASTVRSFNEFPLRQSVFRSRETNQAFELLLRRGQFDIVHVHSEAAGFLLHHFGTSSVLPHVVVSVGNSEPIPSEMRDIYRDPRVRLILAVSQSIARQITTAIGEECAQKVVVVPSGTDLKRFRPLSKDLGIVNEFQLAFHRVVGMVAHVRPYKRVDVYLEASKMVNQSMPDVKFLVVGKIGLPDLRVAARILRQRVKQERGLFCIGNVVYTDMRDDIPRIMSTFDVSVSCSDHFEGVSGAIRESLAMEIPVVCTEVGGNTELVKDGVTGYLVPPGDTQALAEKVCFILENRELAKKTASAGRLYVSHHLSQERRNERIWSLYRSLIGR